MYEMAEDEVSLQSYSEEDLPTRLPPIDSDTLAGSLNEMYERICERYKKKKMRIILRWSPETAKIKSTRRKKTNKQIKAYKKSLMQAVSMGYIDKNEMDITQMVTEGKSLLLTQFLRGFGSDMCNFEISFKSVNKPMSL